jgi:hypothetical protein
LTWWGPGWVSVAASAALVVFHGMLVAALAGRLSWAVPLLAPTPRAIVAHAPLLSVQPGYPGPNHAPPPQEAEVVPMPANSAISPEARRTRGAVGLAST